MDSLCITLTSPGIVEQLEFNILFHGSEYHSFDERLLRDAWSHLDTITTYSTSSQLQRVNINIKYYYYYGEDDFHYYGDDDDDIDHDEEFNGNIIEKTVLDGLPLLRSEGILFVSSVFKNIYRGREFY